MSKLSTSKVTLLGIVFLLVGAVTASGFEPPVKGKIDLSSNFCEHRPAHFHGGIDIRTGGKEGREVFSPVDGYVWRIKYAYDGYGKALYLKDNKGLIYVFGHLSRLNDRLERLVWDYQLKNQVYSFDSYFPADSLPVKTGELLSYSGQSGIGAPHIHFEVRNNDNKPLNPLTNGLNVDDNISPQIEFIGFIYQDDSSVFPNGRRRLNKQVFYDRHRQSYVLNSVVPLKDPFGIKIKAFDQIRQNGPDLNLYRSKLFIDDYIYYETTYEIYDYSETAMTDLCFDYQIAEEKNQYWQNLFIPAGKNFSGDKSLYKEGGIFSVNGYIDYGLHRVRIELYDAAGHMSELNFEFMMLPPGDMFKSVWMDDTTCYLESDLNNKYIDIETVKLFESTGHSSWKPLKSSRIEKKTNGDFEFTIPSGKRRPHAVKVIAAGESGWEETVNYAVTDRQSGIKYSLDYKIVDGGVLFDISTRRNVVSPPVIELLYADGYSKKIETSFAGDGRYAAYYRNKDISTAIAKVNLYSSDETTPVLSKTLNIFHIGGNPQGTSRMELGDIVIESDNGSVYSPTDLEIIKEQGIFAESKSRIGDVYSVGPKTIPLAKNIKLTFKVPDPDKEKIGIYRLSDKGEWRWLKHTKGNTGISAETGFLGQFALIEDTDAPRVKRIYPPDGETVATSYPQISFLVVENLSGIEDHKNIKVYLDDRWLIPEYDPETELLKTYPEKRIKDGRHELKIIVSDRVGNSRTVNTHFFVNTQKK